MVSEKYAFLYILSSILYFSTGMVSYLKDRNDFKRMYLMLSVLLSIWSFLYALIALSSTVEEAYFLYFISLPFKVFCIPVAFRFMILFSGFFADHPHEEAKKEKTLKFLSIVLAYLPTILVLIRYLIAPHFSLQDFVFEENRWILPERMMAKLSVPYFIVFFSILPGYLVFLILGLKMNASRKIKYGASVIVLPLMFLGLAMVDMFTLGMMNWIPRINLMSISPLLFLLPCIYLFMKIDEFSITVAGPKTLIFSIFDYMEEGVAILDRKFNVQYANRGLRRMLQVSQNDGNATVQQKIFQGTLPNRFRESFTDFRKMLSMRGDAVYTLCSYSPQYDRWGEYMGGILLIQDVSDISRAQQALEYSYANLEKVIYEKNREAIRLNEDLERQLTLKENLEKSYIRLSNMDSITNASNRRFFLDFVEEYIQTKPSGFAVFALDIDDFKSINDTKGHNFGDKMLIETANTISEYFERDYLLCRVNGDDFLIMIKNYGTDSEIEKVAEELLTRLREPRLIEGSEVSIQCSIGIALYPTDGHDVEALVRNADLAIYIAKTDKQRKYAFYDYHYQQNVRKRFHLNNEIKEACKKEEFVALYQPQVYYDGDTDRTEIAGYESLARWKHSERGLLSPHEFVDVAEESGSVIGIGSSILRQSCESIIELYNRGYRNFTISVNLSALQLRDPGFIAFVSKVLQETEIDPNYLELEITERSLIEDMDMTFQIFNRLKSLGVRLSVDDFGTAYSSLNYIKTLPVDKLKIDKSFVDSIGENYRSDAILRAIIGISNKLGLEVIAEGVESQWQVDFLWQNGCRMFQGYFFHKPLSMEEIWNQNILPKREILELPRLWEVGR